MSKTKKLILLFVIASFVCVFLFSLGNLKNDNQGGEDKEAISSSKDTLVIDKDDKNESVENHEESQDDTKESSEKTENQTTQKQEQTNQNNISDSASSNVDYAGSKEEQKEEIVVTIHVSVVMKGLNGELLANEMISVEENSSAFHALENVCAKYQMPIQTSGFGKFVYVQAIGDLKEKAYGAQSGWKYSVNGQYVGSSAGAYILQDGDVMEWYYEHD